MRFKVLLFVVHCNLYFYSHSHSLQFAITSVGPAYYILMHKISLLWIPKQQLFCKPNPEMGSRDYKFLNPGYWD